MSFSKRLWVAFGALMLLITLLGGAFFISARMVDQRAVSLASDSLPGVYAVGRAQVLSAELPNLMLMHINSVDTAEMVSLEKDLAKAEDNLKQDLKKYSEENPMGADEQKMFIKLAPALDALFASWEKARVPSRANQPADAMKAFRTLVLPQVHNLGRYLLEEYEYNKGNADSSTTALLKAGSTARTLAWTIALLSLLLAAALARYLVRDLTTRLKAAIGALSEGTEQIKQAAQQVAASSQSLAEGATEQAASLQETSASGQEITAMTQRNSESSAATATLMNEVDRSISEANQKLEQLVAGMQEISHSSGQIAKIIKVIDEIAFQTNILALNAAVEAARAGEAGLGFAVVADEVRNLAQRCAQATKDVSGVIEGSVSSTRNGSSRLAEVAKVVAELTERTARVKALVDDLNTGGAEQAKGIQEISRALVQMEQITQRVAATAEEGASASEELNGQANGMGGVVDELEILVSGRT